ncbi:hypothetical protein [Mesorhizobium sp.]|uniref:hypothetical protein n=1 Tax=Mesorhizobium sp. TaxID=1871066 RepID=UPI0025F2518C|nr:hypothetical protein [Mesorhizobium sp.]
MDVLSAQFARDCGYTGDSPAMLAAFTAIRLDGIGKARLGHDQRKAVVDRLKHGEALFLAAIRPAQSAEEALEDAARFIACYRNMPRWRQERRGADLARAGQQRLLARFFRRFGHRLWAQQAAYAGGCRGRPPPMAGPLLPSSSPRRMSSPDERD